MMDDGISIALGGTAVGALFTFLGTLVKARWSKTRVEPDPLNVQTEPKERYVTKGEFEKHVAENSKEHEALYSRMNRNDRETSEIKGMLGTMMDDLRLIKDKLLKTRRT